MITRFTQLALMVLATLPALACAQDVTFGGSRASGMGGAGLALPFDVFQNTRLNPALHAFGPKGFRLQYPQFGYRTDGLDLSDVTDLIGDLGGDGNEELAIRLARQYGGRNRDFGAQAGLAFFGGGFVLDGFAEATVAGRPNGVLRDFINSDQDPDNAPLDAQIDAYAFGYYSYGIGYANAIQLPQARLATGFRLRQVRAYYAHKKAFGPGIANGNSAGVVNGSNIDPGDDFEETRAFGADFGAIYSLDRVKGLTFGLVVENLIPPNIKFDSERPNNGGLRDDFVNPFRTALNVGVGYAYRQNLLIAADVVDLGNRAGRGEFRTGIEVGLARAFAARAGYNTRTGFTYGIAAGGFNIQLGGQAPLTVGTSVRF